MLMNSRILKRLACVLVQTLGCKVQDKTIIDLLVRTASSVPDKVRGDDGKWKIYTFLLSFHSGNGDLL